MPLLRTLGKAGFTAADLLFPSPKGPRVLIYHQFGQYLGRQMELSVADFERQLDWMGERREIVSFEEALARWDEPGSDQLVALTFDDGFADTYTTAFPILAGRGIPFLVYLATESIETGAALGPPGSPHPLTWGQLEEMLGSGLLTVGGHTHRHSDLRSLPADQIEEELGSCDDLVEKRLGLRPRHFAYPWGYWSERAAESVDRRYESAAIAATPRPAATLDRHKVHRYPVQLADGFRFFPARLRGGLRAEEQVRRWLRRYSGP